MRYLTLLALALLFGNSVHAQSTKPIKLNKIPSSLIGSSILAVGDNGETESVEITGKNVSVDAPSSTNRLYIRDTDGKVTKAIVGPTCTKNKKTGKESCSSSKNSLLAVKSGAAFTLKAQGANLLAAKFSDSKALKKSFSTNVKAATSDLTKAVGSFGLSSQTAPAGKKVVGIKVDDVDSDNDGLVDAIDCDDDGDSIIDNYDASTPVSEGNTFRVFSNFKAEIQSTINLHTTGLTKTRIDELLQIGQTLAIQVAGTSTDTVELNCASLGYCSSGGTGKTVEGNLDFPGTSGGAFDPDGDGFGTITKGATNDFQLKTGATSSQIGAGDTLIELVTPLSSTTSEEYTGMLNFVFNSHPALKSLAVNSGGAETVDYSLTPLKGSGTNCFTAPASGDISATIVGWRPQRPGISEAGESEYVDIGNSGITIDVPNAPCTLSGGGGCSGSGPGNCSAASYSTSDASLTVSGNGLTDGKEDQTADSSNTYSFTINLTNCLGATAWTAGQTLFIDLQFVSRFGDNAAQKFCIKRADS